MGICKPEVEEEDEEEEFDAFVATLSLRDLGRYDCTKGWLRTVTPEEFCEVFRENDPV